MKDALKFLAMTCVLSFLGVNVLILIILYVKWVSKLIGAL